ncbi:hypothetical protein C1646_773755 [Rhizophagus diaphanus]|nr:hypothetical protein C1646_773755 [Rhizophagus diaphanus] [Rhizophagus sp. MUCL 43196]
MHVGNFGLQQDSLSAVRSLYAKEKLNHCSAFKISHDIDGSLHHVCFRFNKALKTFGIRFIKENISENIIDEKNLKNQIKAFQSESKRIDLLMSEYLNDNSISHSERTIKLHQEFLWKLVNNLVAIFEMDNPLSYQLFQKYKPTEIYQKGLDRLIACYPNGLERIKGIY